MSIQHFSLDSKQNVSLLHYTCQSSEHFISAAGPTCGYEVCSVTCPCFICLSLSFICFFFVFFLTLLFCFQCKRRQGYLEKANALESLVESLQKAIQKREIKEQQVREHLEKEIERLKIEKVC